METLKSFYDSIKASSDDEVRNELYRFNYGAYDYLPFEVYRKIAYIIGDEMDIRHLW